MSTLVRTGTHCHHLPCPLHTVADDQMRYRMVCKRSVLVVFRYLDLDTHTHTQKALNERSFKLLEGS